MIFEGCQVGIPRWGFCLAFSQTLGGTIRKENSFVVFEREYREFKLMMVGMGM